MAIFSWRYVEQPFRTGKEKKQASGQSITIAVMATMVLLLGMGLWTMRTDGCPQRMPPAVLAIIDDSSGPSELKALNSDALTCNSDRLPLIGEDNADVPISFVLWGDSHALAVAKLCDKLAKNYRLKGALATKSGATALLGNWNEQVEQEAVNWNHAVLNYVHRNKIPNVIIVSRWSVCADVGNEQETDLFAKALQHTAQSLSGKGIRVWVMMQIPEQPANPQRELALAAWSKRSVPVGITIEQHAEIQQPVFFAFSKLDSSIVLNPHEFCFDAEGRSRIGSGERSFYRDDDHLSYVGAKELIQPLLRPVFAKIADQKTAGMIGASIATDLKARKAFLSKGATW